MVAGRAVKHSVRETPLPPPDPVAQHISAQLVQHIQQQHCIDFARYMDLALYAPGLGYYSAGAQKLGREGDFITAPELSPLFGQCIARQIAEVFNVLGGKGDILEFGAGSGRLAVDILQALETFQILPDRYYILEVSASLKARQQALIASVLSEELAERVVWLDGLIEDFSGVILANEVLDAMPVHRFRYTPSGVQESFVCWEQNKLTERFDAASPAVQKAVAALGIEFAENYTSEISLIIPAWIKSISQCLTRGLILLIDYGFVQREYYHPDRHMGTLMCHYRHHAHDDFLFYPGLQDITAHVDFSVVARSAVENALQVVGYTTQANFLMGCGLLNTETPSYETAQAIKRLLLPSEMGELFKVIGLSKDVDQPWMGFALHDMRERL